MGEGGEGGGESIVSFFLSTLVDGHFSFVIILVHLILILFSSLLIVNQRITTVIYLLI